MFSLCTCWWVSRSRRCRSLSTRQLLHAPFGGRYPSVRDRNWRERLTGVLVLVHEDADGLVDGDGGVRVARLD